MEGTLWSSCGDPGAILISHGRDVMVLQDCAVDIPRLEMEDEFFKNLEAQVLSDNRYICSEVHCTTS